MKQFFAAAAIAATLGAGLDAQASAATTAPDLGSVLSALTSRMDAVSSYQARVSLDVHLHTFPFLDMTLEGTTSYTRPGKYSVTFDSLPSLASSFQNVSGDIGDPAAWPQKYRVSVDPSTTSASPGTLVLRLVEKDGGQVDHVLADVDLASSTVTHMDWFYKSGGEISMDQHFAPIDGVLLADRQNAEIDMPGYRATALAHFHDYSLQVAVNPRPMHAH